MKDWASELCGLFSQEKNQDVGVLFATVKSVSPVSVVISGQELSKYIFVTSGVVEMGDLSIKPGDTVICVRSGKEFYMIAKVM